MKQVVLEVHPAEPCETVRVDRAAAQILRRLQRETGMTVKGIASKLICAAAEQVEVREVD